MTVERNVHVRAATAEDRGFVLDTARRLADFTLPNWRRADDVVAAEVRGLGEAFDAGRHAHDLYVAVDGDGALLGFLFLERPVDYFTGQPHGHVSMLAVVPAAEGRGVGRALMARAEGWARDHGFAHLTLNVFDRNTRAKALYERLDYQPDTVRYLKVLAPEPDGTTPETSTR
jgi:ribosomal protein S18 acetylase RimI-like enzyme